MPDDKRALDYLRQFGYLPVEAALGSPQGPAAVRACQAMALLPAAGTLDTETVPTWIQGVNAALYRRPGIGGHRWFR
ncbi:hypothetical protein J8N05_30635 [Streptomyces sp. BH-SS-21]|uniref:Uncharacterized protein n=1 Tax=Streptomyces liliiviolaceus TaxID=2823109 RepID=A0A941BGA4_9ACTN|nr:hypothetical protein [Streptomyces liliiviolaceus]MBQ0852524.1 hypothetical protein [Streptomyces liliiviolaceus]